MERKKIIIDTDIGDDIDDAFAIALAMASPELEILGVTTVYKNVAQRAHIVKNLLVSGGFGNVPVYAGVNQPLKEPIAQFPCEAMGENGLITLRHYSNEMNIYPYNEGSAIDFILDTADRYPGEVTLVAIGPLTNVATAYNKRKESFMKLKEVVLMNGFFVTQYAEWNVMCDPEACRITYGCGLPVKAVGANCTHLTEVFENDLKKIRALKGETGKLLNDMLTIWLKDNGRNCVMHDGLALSVLYGDYVTLEEQNIYVPLEQGVRGYTLRVDGNTPVAPQASVSVSVDARAFLDDMMDRLAKFTKKIIDKEK